MEKNFDITNVVASVNLNQKVDLETVARTFPTVEYKPDRFPGLIYRLKKLEGTILVFATGKMVVAGAKSENGVKRAVSKIVNEFKNGGIVIIGKPDIKISNVVASGNLGYKVDLEEAAKVLEGILYDPDLFPGLIYRLKQPKVVMLIFSTGKFVCAGANREVQVQEAVKKLCEMLISKGVIIRPSNQSYTPKWI